MKVKNYMTRDITSVLEETSMEYLIKVLFRHKRSTIPVVNNENKVIGSVSTTNIYEALQPGQINHSADLEDLLRTMKEKKVSNYLHTGLPIVYENDEIIKAINLLLRNNLDAIFVVNNEHILTGFISSIDLLASIIKH